VDGDKKKNGSPSAEYERYPDTIVDFGATRTNGTPSALYANVKRVAVVGSAMLVHAYAL